MTGYARQRSGVWPPSRRGATVLSPYIRHGLLTVGRVHDHVTGPPADVRRFRQEVLWQEYCRHLYVRAGTASRAPLRRAPAVEASAWPDPIPPDMRCVDEVRTELERTGWMVNQTRMWMASQWTVRAGHDWRAGEDRMFRHLLDGSRAANRYGWQWTVGAMTSKPYGFSRWQVRKRAPAWCQSCARRDDCPIGGWPTATSGARVDDAHLKAGPDGGGPRTARVTGEPETVWLTAESLGDDDPALAAHPERPVGFVFDEPLLGRLRLSAKRLVFLTETLADLATRRSLTVHLGDPVAVLAGRRLAVTFAPVPGYARRAGALDVVDERPWPWFRRPDGGDVSSYTAWVRRGAGRSVTAKDRETPGPGEA